MVGGSQLSLTSLRLRVRVAAEPQRQPRDRKERNSSHDMHRCHLVQLMHKVVKCRPLDGMRGFRIDVSFILLNLIVVTHQISILNGRS
jgi:hypothetical protein